MANEHDYPNLTAENYRITSPRDPKYNCVAWAAGSSDTWWECTKGYYWPVDYPTSPSVNALKDAYAALGFVECDNSNLEPGFEKLAIYALNEEYMHAARQLPNGWWTSKLGPDEDIEHQTLEALLNRDYARIACIMRRPIPALTSTSR
ncbi:MAG TPA: hypothetical protein VKX17_24975 [Planctomycetota bacterium]|nr:hypothetical protein [Planctomycetota bacterium]